MCCQKSMLKQKKVFTKCKQKLKTYSQQKLNSHPKYFNLTFHKLSHSYVYFIKVY